MIKELNNHYSFTNPATVHDEEALTSLELAGRTAAKVNEVVRAQNTLAEQTLEHLENQDVSIEKIRTETVPADVTKEVQKQIDNGTFNRQIDESLGNLEERVDNLLNNTPEGSTTMDAEVIDLRVGADNVTYVNAGDSVRSQLSRVTEVEKTPFTLIHGYWIQGSTGLQMLSGVDYNYHCSDYIPTYGNGGFYLNNAYDRTSNVASGDGSGYAFYDKNHKYISGKTFYEIYVESGEFLSPLISATIPDGAVYVRVTAKTDNPEKVTFTFENNVSYLLGRIKEVEDNTAEEIYNLQKQNIVRPNTTVKTWIHPDNGTTQNYSQTFDPEYRASDFVYVGNCETIHLYNIYERAVNSTDKSGWAFYDSNFKYLSGMSAYNWSLENDTTFPENALIDIPEGASYIRYTIFVSDPEQ